MTRNAKTFKKAAEICLNLHLDPIGDQRDVQHLVLYCVYLVYATVLVEGTSYGNNAYKLVSTNKYECLFLRASGGFAILAWIRSDCAAPSTFGC